MSGISGDEEEELGLKSILFTDNRDFLINNNGDQVKLDDQLKDKVVGVYFSASFCGPSRLITIELSGIYKEINDVHDNKFEVVFVSADESEDTFPGYFKEMPWLAVPFSDSAATCDHLNERFKAEGFPLLMLLDGRNGNVISNDALEVLQRYGPAAYPFTEERVETLKKEEEEAKKNQTITSVLASSSRNFVISNNGDQVPVTQLEGKMVGIYFSGSPYGSFSDITPAVENMYTGLKGRGVAFDVVFVSLHFEKETFDEAFRPMPWFAVPFGDWSCARLARYFELETIPALVVIGPDGKTIHGNVAEYAEEHGAEAYPFSPEKISQLEEIEKARRESQTLESLLISGDLNYVLGKGNIEVPVKQLVGCTILFYFSARWCPPCRSFTPKLAQIYKEIKDKDDKFEVIFVSSDTEKSSFEEYHSEMPWLALPFRDARKKLLIRRFQVQGIPTLVAVGSSGRTLTTEARGLVMNHGAKAFPFTDERLKELKEEADKEGESLPEKVRHELHEHVLVKTRRDSYCCDVCDEDGSGWFFFCEECDFAIHPDCALEGAEGEVVIGEANAGEGGRRKGKEKEEDGGDAGQGNEIVCDGEASTSRPPEPTLVNQIN